MAKKREEEGAEGKWQGERGQHTQISMQRSFSLTPKKYTGVHNAERSQTAWGNKKYRGHRIIPDSILRDLEKL